MLNHVATRIQPGHHFLSVPLPHWMMTLVEVSIVANRVWLIILLLLFVRYACSLFGRHEGAGRGTIGICRSVTPKAWIAFLLPSRSSAVSVSIIKCAFLILLLHWFSILCHFNSLCRIFLLIFFSSSCHRSLCSAVHFIGLTKASYSFLWLLFLTTIFCFTVGFYLCSRKSNCLRRFSGSRRRSLETLDPIYFLSHLFFSIFGLILLLLAIRVWLDEHFVHIALSLRTSGRGSVSGVGADSNLLSYFLLVRPKLTCQLIRLTTLQHIHVYII